MWLDRFRTPHPQTTTEKVETPRATRFELDVLISFTVADQIENGRCINVSASGLAATFDKGLELWEVGLLELEAGEHYLSINAKVARVRGRDVGFAFLIETENDRATISILIQSVLSRPLDDLDPAAA